MHEGRSDASCPPEGQGQAPGRVTVYDEAQRAVKAPAGTQAAESGSGARRGCGTDKIDTGATSAGTVGEATRVIVVVLPTSSGWSS